MRTHACLAPCVTTRIFSVHLEHPLTLLLPRREHVHIPRHIPCNHLPWAQVLPATCAPGRGFSMVQKLWSRLSYQRTPSNATSVTALFWFPPQLRGLRPSVQRPVWRDLWQNHVPAADGPRGSEEPSPRAGAAAQAEVCGGLQRDEARCPGLSPWASR